MSTYFNNYIQSEPLSGFVADIVIEEIDSVIKIASANGGKVFGGYVRGVLIPLGRNPKCPISFKDVDLWFRTPEDAEKFVTAMGDRFKHYPSCSTDSDNIHYPFVRNQYHLMSHDTCVAWFDVIVSDSFPVDDFDVNCLTFYYEGEFPAWNIESPTKSNFLELESRILNRECQLLQSMIDLFHLVEPAARQQTLCLRFLNRYHRLGWKIKIGDEVVDEKSLSDHGLFRLWVQKHGIPSTECLENLMQTYFDYCQVILVREMLQRRDRYIQKYPTAKKGLKQIVDRLLEKYVTKEEK